MHESRQNNEVRLVCLVDVRCATGLQVGDHVLRASLAAGKDGMCESFVIVLTCLVGILSQPRLEAQYSRRNAMFLCTGESESRFAVGKNLGNAAGRKCSIVYGIDESL